MISKAHKAQVMRKWSAMGQVWVCMVVFMVALVATLMITVLGVFFDFQISSLLPANLAAFIVLASGVIRLFLVRRGWCAMTAHEIKYLPTYFKKQSHLYPLDIDTDKPMHMDDRFAADVLDLCKNEGFVSWLDFNKLAQKHGAGKDLVEWMFVGRGQEAPATVQDWETICSERARLDASSAKAQGTQAPRRL